jgi:hypothetical protein
MRALNDPPEPVFALSKTLRNRPVMFPANRLCVLLGI